MADEQVTYLWKKTPRATENRSSKAVNAAMRSGGQVETSKKYGGGGNRQHMSQRDSAAVCRDTEELKVMDRATHKASFEQAEKGLDIPRSKGKKAMKLVETVSLDVGKLIQKGRMAKELSQKELATRINEKPQVINDYEAGRAIPNNQILSKIERVIGLKLRGKDKGKPLGGAKK